MKKLFLVLLLLLFPILVFPGELPKYSILSYSRIRIRRPHHKHKIILKRVKRGKKVIWFGFNGGYDLTTNVWNAGGQLKLPAGPFLFIPGSSIYFTQNNIDWQANIDIALAPRFSCGLYGGVGLAIAGRDTTGVGTRARIYRLESFCGISIASKENPCETLC